MRAVLARCKRDESSEAKCEAKCLSNVFAGIEDHEWVVFVIAGDAVAEKPRDGGVCKRHRDGNDLVEVEGDDVSGSERFDRALDVSESPFAGFSGDEDAVSRPIGSHRVLHRARTQY